MPKSATKGRGVMKKGISTLLCAGMLTVGMTVPVQAENGSDSVSFGSRVAYSDPAYERDETLEVAGEPFFYNGVQIRIDKVRDWYHYTDEQVKQLLQTAKDDGFTVANVQIRWMDVQPDQEFKASESAYIRGGDYADQAFTGNGLQACNDTEVSNQTMSYLKFNISDWERDNVEGSRLRVYLNTDLYFSHNLEVYGIEDTSWDANTLTWNNAPSHEEYEVTGELLSSSPDWDLVKKKNYYDFDVTEYVEKQRAAGHTEVSFAIKSVTPEGKEPNVPIMMDDHTSAEKMPRLFLSSMEEYDWSCLDQIMGWAEEIGIKLEVLWFATDTCSLSTDIRVPYYVLRNYQKCVKSDGTPWLQKASWNNITGTYQYLMCKNDPDLQAQEYKALKDVFNHIAQFNEKNGNKNVVIGCQVCNEPNVARLHGGGVKDPDGTRLQSCMCAVCQKLKSDMKLSDQGFRDYTMFEYCNNLSKAVKESDYPVWTRVNNVQGNDAWGVTYNEDKRSKGGTDKDGGTYLDFIGLDPYGWSRGDLYRYGQGDYSSGRNLPMVMECGGEKSMSALMMLATVAGGAYYNVYDLCSPDGHAMYGEDMQPRVIGAGDKYLPNGGTYIEDIRNHNHLLNKIAYELAVKKPDSIGGKNLLFFNCEGTESTNIKVTKQIDGVDVTYQSNTKYSSGIAVKRSDTEIVLLNTLGKDATFTLTQIAGDIKSVEYGHYEGWEWAADTDVLGKASYKISGKDLVVTMPSFSCIRVETNNNLPAPTIYEVEDLDDAGLVTVSNGLTIGNWDEAAAHAGGWIEIKNAPVGATVSFQITVPDNMLAAQIATGYKANTSGRGSVQLSVNGANYGTPLNMAGSYGYKLSDAGPVVALNPGQVNTFTYTVTKAGALCFDYIKLTRRESMPQQLEGTVLINEEFSNMADNFGFPAGASVKDGILNITEGMGNYTTSVKNFDADVIGQSAVDFTFDWKTTITSSGKKTGIEFRDIYGRLIFALQSKSGTELRYSASGRDSDSGGCQYDWEPTWRSTSMSRDTTYTVRVYADFEAGTVSYSVAEKSSGNIVAQEIDVPTEAAGLAKMVACNYYTNENGTNHAGIQIIDNFKLIGAEGELDLPYEGKKIYAFGDGIVSGYTYDKAGFIDFVAAVEGMELAYDGSVEGAAIMQGSAGGQIVEQINQAPEETPDIIIFNGGTNDAYEKNSSKWGSVDNESDSASLDLETVAGNFESIICRMQEKWPEAEIVYVSAHKMSAGRPAEYQDMIHEITVAACKKWGIRVADLYAESLLDTRDDNYRWNYTFSDLGLDGLPGNMATTSSEKFNADFPSGIYPNFRGIEEFYLPMLSETLRQAPSNPSVLKGKATLTATDKINNVAGERFYANVQIGNLPEGTKLTQMALEVPDALEVVNVEVDSTLSGGTLDWNVDTAAEVPVLRAVYTNLQSYQDITTTETDVFDLFTIELELKEQLADGEKIALVLKDLSCYTSSEESVVFDLIKDTCEVEVLDGAELKVSVTELYAGDGADIIPADRKAVKAVFTGIPEDFTGNIIFHGDEDEKLYHSIDFIEKDGVESYIFMVPADTALEKLEDAANYSLTEDLTESILFGDTNKDNVIDAQDALNEVTLWLRKVSPEITSELVLIYNVTGDGRINNADALAVVEHFITGNSWKVLNVQK